MTPRVTDNDAGEIIVSLYGQELRGWSYNDDAERRAKMLAAREYVEGWCDARCSAVSAEPIPACKNCMHKGSHLAWRCDACGFEVERSLPNEPQSACEDPTASKKWNDGCDFAMTQLCKFLDVEPSSVSWDAATETVEGDVSAVIGNILRAKFGEDWGPQCQAVNVECEEERHAIEHARFQADRASPDDPECRFDFDLVKTLLRVIDRSLSRPKCGGSE